jgi:CDP-paratose 2-epimerase
VSELDGPVLITGGAGFIGSNLADRIATAGRDVIILDSLARAGVERNLVWLQGRHGAKIRPMVADVRDDDALARAVADAAAVFHLAAQVAVTSSLADPLGDFAINLATVKLLEVTRARGRGAPFIFASTNKVYGDLADVPLTRKADAYAPPAHLRSGVDERRRLDFHSPYGCSKGAADQYVLDWRRSYGLPTCVLRMSCIYGPRQMGTEDQGWVAHFARRALAQEPISIYGDGRQVRDVLHVADAVAAYLSAWSRIEEVAGRAFNLGGGPDNAVSLLQVIGALERLTRRRIEVRFSDWRVGDQRYYVSDARAVRAALELPAARPWREGLADLFDWLRAEVAPVNRPTMVAAQ